jgi:hypothetical protein
MWLRRRVKRDYDIVVVGTLEKKAFEKRGSCNK